MFDFFNKKDKKKIDIDSSLIKITALLREESKKADFCPKF